ncbi:hypothetical protein D1872_303570 [compost metagenome]
MLDKALGQVQGFRNPPGLLLNTVGNLHPVGIATSQQVRVQPGRMLPHHDQNVLDSRLTQPLNPVQNHGIFADRQQMLVND